MKAGIASPDGHDGGLGTAGLASPAVAGQVDRHVRPRPADALLRTMDRAGWALDWVDMDLTGTAPRLEIRASRHDGLWLRSYVDELGRATVERFHRERHLGMRGNEKGRRPLVPLVDDHFMGRQRYEGGRALMRGLCAYLTGLYDLRHEAISCLVETARYTIPEMMLVTGHKDPKQLMRYTQLRARDFAVKAAVLER